MHSLTVLEARSSTLDSMDKNRGVGRAILPLAAPGSVLSLPSQLLVAASLQSLPPSSHYLFLKIFLPLCMQPLSHRHFMDLGPICIISCQDPISNYMCKKNFFLIK